MHGKQCRDCYNLQHPPHPAAASAASAPPSSPSPTLSMFGRPSGCIDQLTTVERAAIVTLQAGGRGCAPSQVTWARLRPWSVSG